MFRCVLCAFDFTLDDVKLDHGDGRVVCLFCYSRQTDSVKRPTRNYRRELVAAAEGA